MIILWPPYGRPLAILEEVSASSARVMCGMLWFQVEVHSTWNLEQYWISLSSCPYAILLGVAQPNNTIKKKRELNLIYLIHPYPPFHPFSPYQAYHYKSLSEATISDHSNGNKVKTLLHSSGGNLGFGRTTSQWQIKKVPGFDSNDRPNPDPDSTTAAYHEVYRLRPHNRIQSDMGRV